MSVRQAPHPISTARIAYLDKLVERARLAAAEFAQLCGGTEYAVEALEAAEAIYQMMGGK